MGDIEEKLTKIEIYSGTPTTPYKIIGPIEAKVHASTAFSKAPTLEDVNSIIKEKALKMGANAVINVEYNRRSVSWTGYKFLTAKGQAVVVQERGQMREAPEVLAICPKCHERVPLDTKFCTECGANLKPKK